MVYITMGSTTDSKGMEFMSVLTYIYGGIVGCGIGIGFIAELVRYIITQKRNGDSVSVCRVLAYLACIFWGWGLIIPTAMTAYYEIIGNQEGMTLSILICWSVFLGVFLLGFVISLLGAVGVRIVQCLSDDEEVGVKMEHELMCLLDA